jgi:hypothetical protein
MNRTRFRIGLLVLILFLFTAADFTGPVSTGFASTTPSGALFLTKAADTASAGMQVDAAGGMHVGYVQYPAAGYAYCAPTADCSKVANWAITPLSLANNIFKAQLVVTPDGRPRMILVVSYDPTSDRGYVTDTYWYAACESGCANSANWSMAFLGDSADNDTTIFDWSPHYFALDPQGRPRLVYGPLYKVDPVTFAVQSYFVFATCDQSCTATKLDPATGKPVAANWTSTQIDGGLSRPALAFTSAGLPRVAGWSDDGSGLSFTAHYLECNSACTDPASWSVTPLPARNSSLLGSASLVLRLNSQDRPRLAVSPDQSDLSYLSCNGACGTAGNWASRGIGLAQGDGSDADLRFDGQDHPRMSFRAATNPDTVPGGLGFGEAFGWCNANCESTSGSWQRQLAEPATQLDAEWPIPPPAGCQAGWIGGFRSSLALDSAGNPRIAYDAEHWHGVGSCSPDRDATAVRILYFNQPGQSTPTATPTPTSATTPPPTATPTAQRLTPRVYLPLLRK